MRYSLVLRHRGLASLAWILVESIRGQTITFPMPRIPQISVGNIWAEQDKMREESEVYLNKALLAIYVAYDLDREGYPLHPRFISEPTYVGNRVFPEMRGLRFGPIGIPQKLELTFFKERPSQKTGWFYISPYGALTVYSKTSLQTESYGREPIRLYPPNIDNRLKNAGEHGLLTETVDRNGIEVEGLKTALLEAGWLNVTKEVERKLNAQRPWWKRLLGSEMVKFANDLYAHPSVLKESAEEQELVIELEFLDEIFASLDVGLRIACASQDTKSMVSEWQTQFQKLQREVERLQGERDSWRSYRESIQSAASLADDDIRLVNARRYLERLPADWDPLRTTLEELTIAHPSDPSGQIRIAKEFEVGVGKLHQWLTDNGARYSLRNTYASGARTPYGQLRIGQGGEVPIAARPFYSDHIAGMAVDVNSHGDSWVRRMRQSEIYPDAKTMKALTSGTATEKAKALSDLAKEGISEGMLAKAKDAYTQDTTPEKAAYTQLADRFASDLATYKALKTEMRQMGFEVGPLIDPNHISSADKVTISRVKRQMAKEYVKALNVYCDAVKGEIVANNENLSAEAASIAKASYEKASMQRQINIIKQSCKHALEEIERQRNNPLYRVVSELGMRFFFTLDADNNVVSGQGYSADRRGNVTVIDYSQAIEEMNSTPVDPTLRSGDGGIYLRFEWQGETIYGIPQPPDFFMK